MFTESDTTEDTVVLWGMSKDLYAQYLLDNGRYEEAFSQFQEAFLTSCELFGDTHSQSLILLNSLGKSKFNSVATWQACLKITLSALIL